MSKYPALVHSVGDVVTVRQDLQPGEYYNGVLFIDNMLEYCGKELTIEVRDIDISGEVPYYIVENNAFVWNDAMFEDDIVEPVSIDVGDIL